MAALLGSLFCIGVWGCWGTRSPNLPLLVEQTHRRSRRVYLEGAVRKSGWVRVPAGARRCDLGQYAYLAPDADPDWFQSRRALQDGEQIVVPRAAERRSLVENGADW
jgi:hypothetical protein